MKNLLITGYGNIGKHIHSEFKNLNVSIQDPVYNGDKIKKEVIYDIEFICVPTDNDVFGKVDTSIVESCINSSKSKIIVLKSTVPVGFCDSLNNPRVVYSPEYYGTTQHAPKSPDFLVLAGNSETCDKVAQLYYEVKAGDFKIHFTDYKTAELAKYMENCFLGLKVTFCNEFADIAKDFGISYPKLREIFISDHRMGASHTFVNPEQPYYNSHCLNKDIPALINQTDKAKLMTACMDINLSKKRNYGFD